MTQKELETKLVESGLVRRKEVSEIVTKTFEIIKESIINDDPLSIIRFGKFEVIDVQERVGRNPQTNEEVIIPARKKIKFVPAKALKEEVN